MLISRARTMIAGQLRFHTTSPATSAGVPRWMNVSACVTSRNSATASNSSGITNEKIRTKFSPLAVRVRQRSIPIANPIPIGTQIKVVGPPRLSVGITAWWRLGLCSTDVTWLPTYHLVEKPCHVACDAPLLNENSTAMAIGTIDHTMYSQVNPSSAHARRHGFRRGRPRAYSGSAREGLDTDSVVVAISLPPSMLER